MSKPNYLSENQREILRALIELNLKPSAVIAVDAGVNRGSMNAALAGKRAMPAEFLRNLLAQLNISESWEVSHSVAHYLRVGSDIEPLQRVVDVIYQSSEMYYIQTADQKIDFDEPYTGFFLLKFNTKDNHGLALIHRDRFRTGKGVVSMDPDLALPITPSIFKNVAWSDNPVIELPENIIKDLERPFYDRTDGPDLKSLRATLNMAPEFSWTDVRMAAEHFKLSAEDVIRLIEKAQDH